MVFFTLLISAIHPAALVAIPQRNGSKERQAVIFGDNDGNVAKTNTSSRFGAKKRARDGGNGAAKEKSHPKAPSRPPGLGIPLNTHEQLTPLPPTTGVFTRAAPHTSFSNQQSTNTHTIPNLAVGTFLPHLQRILLTKGSTGYGRVAKVSTSTGDPRAPWEDTYVSGSKSGGKAIELLVSKISSEKSYPILITFQTFSVSPSPFTSPPKNDSRRNRIASVSDDGLSEVQDYEGWVGYMEEAVLRDEAKRVGGDVQVFDIEDKEENEEEGGEEYGTKRKKKRGGERERKGKGDNEKGGKGGSKNKRRRKEEEEEKEKVMEVIDLLSSSDEEIEEDKDKDKDKEPNLHPTSLTPMSVDPPSSPEIVFSDVKYTLQPDPLPVIPIRTLVTVPLSTNCEVYGFVTGSYVNRRTTEIRDVMQAVERYIVNGDEDGDVGRDDDPKKIFEEGVVRCKPPDPILTYTVELGWGTCFCPSTEDGVVNPNPFPSQGRVLNSMRRNAIGSGKKKRIVKKSDGGEEDDDAVKCVGSSSSNVSMPSLGSPKVGRSVVLEVNASDRARVGIREGWLNDNAVNFLTSYQVNLEGSESICVFNSFFFTRLFSCLDTKLPPRTTRLGLTWSTLQSSTPLNLWSSRYLIMPINYNGHWSLVVVANAKKAYEEWLDHSGDTNDERSAAILLFDSGKKLGAHAPAGIYRAIRVFLNAAWNGLEEGGGKGTDENWATKKKTKAKAKKGDDGGGATKNSVSSCSLVGIPSQPTPPQEIFSYNGRNLPGYAPSFIPQQWNNSDCGMFLLVYLRNILSLIRDEGEMVTKEDVQAKSIFRQNTWGSSEMWKKNNIILRLREHFQGVMGGFDMTGQ